MAKVENHCSSCQGTAQVQRPSSSRASVIHDNLICSTVENGTQDIFEKW